MTDVSTIPANAVQRSAASVSGRQAGQEVPWGMRLQASLFSFAALLQIGAMQGQPIKTGPAIGQSVPDFSAPDQANQTQNLKSIMGPKGAMLVFFRSADW